MPEAGRPRGVITLQQRLQRKFVTTFHGTYNFNSKLKKYYNSVMVRSDLIIVDQILFSHT